MTQATRARNKPTRTSPPVAEDVLSDDEMAEFIARAMEDIAYFAEMVCDDAVTTKIPAFHVEIYDAIVEKSRVALAAPRGFAKSTIIAKIYPLWLAITKRRKDVCIISASETLAVDHLRWIKQSLEGNPLILSTWGNLKSDKWSENHIIILHPDGTRVNIRAKGAGGQIRGFRPDCLILDDIETDESVASEEQRKKLKEWLFKACVNCLLPKGQLLVIGTIIHPLAVLEDLLEMPNNWFKKRYKAYKDGIQEEGHELWPEERPHEWLQRRKAEIGSWAFASEYLNNPILDETAPIKQHQIRYWTELPDDISLVITVDPAYSADVRSDFKTASLIGANHKADRFLCEYIHTHKPVGEFQDSILNLYVRYKSRITAIGVPKGGIESEFYRSFIAKANERKIYPPFMELKNSFKTASGSTVREKKLRIIAALQPLFEQGKYFIGKDHVEARDELLAIGNSRWDDIVDTMAYAEQILQPYHKEVSQDIKIDKYGTKTYPEPRLARAPNYGMET